MTPLTIGLLALVVIGAAIIVYAFVLRSKEQAQTNTEEIAPPQPPLEPWVASTGWAAQAGEEFAGLSESARCDLVFAVADLDDEHSQTLLLNALDDPSETVALAAAHILAKRGSGETVTKYAQRHPGDRAERLTQTLELLG